MLQVGGATIHFKTAGRSPALLLLPGGDGDAGAFDLALPDLTDRFTVVMCDRRGVAQSTLEDPQEEMSIERHADDAQAVLTAVTDGPALVLPRCARSQRGPGADAQDDPRTANARLSRRTARGSNEQTGMIGTIFDPGWSRLHRARPA